MSLANPYDELEVGHEASWEELCDEIARTIEQGGPLAYVRWGEVLERLHRTPSYRFVLLFVSRTLGEKHPIDRALLALLDPGEAPDFPAMDLPDSDTIAAAFLEVGQRQALVRELVELPSPPTEPVFAQGLVVLGVENKEDEVL